MDTICTYRDRRDEILVAFLYNDIDPSEREAFETHLAACAACRHELDELGVVREQLGQWAPPEPVRALSGQTERGGPDKLHPTPFKIRPTAADAVHQPSRWQRLGELPGWAQVAAAMLFLGASLAVANLHVAYDSTGLSVRTGWLAAPPSAATGTSAESTPASASTPWRAELTALEAQLRSEMRSSTAQSAAPAPAVEADAILRRVRALIEQSEQRQQRELALRIAEVDNSVRAQRVADLRNIDRNLTVIQSNTGVDMRRLYNMTNELAVRVSQTR